MKHIVRSIGAILAGILVGAVLSIATDTILEQTGIIPSIAEQMANGSPTWFLILAIIYRTIYTVFSCYLGARLAPNYPMRHAIILGVIAFLANLGGTIGMWSLGQHWYPIILTILALPSALVGGRLVAKQNSKEKLT